MSRYSIQETGDGFAVEDKATGERISYHHTWSTAALVALLLENRHKQERKNEGSF